MLWSHKPLPVIYSRPHHNRERARTREEYATNVYRNCPIPTPEGTAPFNSIHLWSDGGSRTDNLSGTVFRQIYFMILLA